MKLHAREESERARPDQINMRGTSALCAGLEGISVGVKVARRYSVHRLWSGLKFCRIGTIEPLCEVEWLVVHCGCSFVCQRFAGTNRFKGSMRRHSIASFDRLDLIPSS
jgi:hypothetical protein